MKIATATYAGLLALASLPVVAGQSKRVDYQALYDACIARSGPINNGTVAACGEHASEEAKKEINVLYKRLHNDLSKKSTGDAALLEQAQRSWVKYRNSQCQLAGNYVGSPMYVICPMNLNISRVNELRELLGD